jgi:Predicted membrane protein
MVQLALFTAIILLLAFTPLGYIKTGTLSITLIGIPVIVGAIILGPSSGAFLGGVFGITSFIQCFGMDPFGGVLLGIDPVKTFLMCMVPRILMGWLTAVIFKGLYKLDKKRIISYAATSLIGSLLNTVLFMSFLIIFFINNAKVQELIPVASKGPIAFFVAIAGINGTAEAIVSMIVAASIAKVLHRLIKKNEI